MFSPYLDVLSCYECHYLLCATYYRFASIRKGKKKIIPHIINNENEEVEMFFLLLLVYELEEKIPDDETVKEVGKKFLFYNRF